MRFRPIVRDLFWLGLVVVLAVGWRWEHLARTEIDNGFQRNRIDARSQLIGYQRMINEMIEVGNSRPGRIAAIPAIAEEQPGLDRYVPAVFFNHLDDLQRACDKLSRFMTCFDRRHAPSGAEE